MKINSMKQHLRKAFRKFGYDLVSFDPRFNFEARKSHLLKKFNINHVLDVGANIGQFGTYLRQIGYFGQITSFEPMSVAYDKLKQTTNNDPNWTPFCGGLGVKEESVFINISKNSFSSSIKEILPLHLEVHPDSATESQETINLYALDSIFDKFVKPESKVLLKIDTQGFESEVLEGAIESLNKIDIVILEMSLEPLYSDQYLFSTLFAKMKTLGFKASILESCDENYEDYTILQMDGWFIK